MVAVKQLAKDYLEAGALNGLIGLYGFVGTAAADPTFLTKGGDLGTVIRVEGVDAECLDHPQIDQIARRFEAALRMFDERFRVYQYLLKRDHAEIPHRDYPNPVVQHVVLWVLNVKAVSGKTANLLLLVVSFGIH